MYIGKILFAFLLQLSLLNLLLLPTSLYAENIDLPDIGESAAGAVTPTEEYQTGQAVVRNIRRAGGILDDALLNDYINHLGYQLVSSSTARMKNFHFFMVNDGQINAFALPGGFIGINYGLILASDSESELASVVAHEIAHVTQRHHARTYEFAGQGNIPAMAALIAAIILGGKNYEVGEAAMATLAASSIQSQLDFTRENEKEADHIGIALLADAGFNPHSMASFFEKLERNARLYGSDAPEFLRTHPVNQTRIADARNRAKQQPQGSLPEQKNYQLMRSRIRVLTSTNPKATLQYFEKNLNSGNYVDQDAEYYGYALSLTATGQTDKARKIFNALLKNDPQRIAYLVAAANLESEAGQHEKAIHAYEKALNTYPANATLTQHYVKTLFRAKHAQKAQQVLQNYLRTPPEDPAFYKLFAEVEEKLGHRANAQAAMGEYYYHIGQPHQAITQLTMALRNKGLSFYDSARIEARLKEVKEEIALLNASHK